MEDETPQEEKISKKLNIEFSPETAILKQSSNTLPIVADGKDIQDIDLKKDYLTVRKNLREILMSGADAIDSVLTVAKESDSPRAYEVAAQLIKAVADVNKDLLEIHKKVKEIEQPTESGQKAASITNNSIFVGSTKDLQSIVRERYKELMNTKVVESKAEVIEDDNKTE